MNQWRQVEIREVGQRPGYVLEVATDFNSGERVVLLDGREVGRVSDVQLTLAREVWLDWTAYELATWGGTC